MMCREFDRADWRHKESGEPAVRSQSQFMNYRWR